MKDVTTLKLLINVTNPNDIGGIDFKLELPTWVNRAEYAEIVAIARTNADTHEPLIVKNQWQEDGSLWLVLTRTDVVEVGGFTATGKHWLVEIEVEVATGGYSLEQEESMLLKDIQLAGITGTDIYPLYYCSPVN
jgi:hypothetical protein